MQLMFTEVKQRVGELLQENSSTLLTAGGVVGAVATAVLAGRAGYKAAEILGEENRARKAEFMKQEQAAIVEVPKDMIDKWDKVKLVWPHFIPPVVTGSATVGSIIMANRMSAQKAAALAAAYGLAEKQFSEYKDKVEEKLTGPKKQAIDDELAQDRVNNTPGGSQIVIVEGDVLCFDEPTGRYFRGSMDKIHKAVNRTNEEILHHNYASASFFYEELGLPPTTWSDEVGWNVNNLVQLKFSTVLSHDQKPCISIDFERLPNVDYVRGY
jgi:gas vesicle protein